jgi:molybdopterin-guanine dinucleotide biosynthesis protein A
MSADGPLLLACPQMADSRWQTDERSTGFSGVILAGGKSRRMGRDKGQLMLRGETLAARAVRTLSALADDVILVTNTPEAFEGLSARLTDDQIPGGGALSGIHAGLTAARHEWALVVACDMPFLNLDLLRYMASLAPGASGAALVPRWQGELETLHTFYSRQCLSVIEPILLRGGGRIIEFYQRIHVRYVEPEEIVPFDPQGLSFFNVNSPEDWARALELAARE